jgi:hypothetical protein
MLTKIRIALIRAIAGKDIAVVMNVTHAGLDMTGVRTLLLVNNLYRPI